MKTGQLGEALTLRPLPARRGASTAVGRLLLLVSFASLIALSQPSTAHACVCEPITDAQMFLVADYVIRGTVEQVSFEDGYFGKTAVLRVRIVHRWKGAPVSVLEVRDPYETDCSMGPRAGDDRIIFAYFWDDIAPDELWSSTCSAGLYDPEWAKRLDFISTGLGFNFIPMATVRR